MGTKLLKEDIDFALLGEQAIKGDDSGRKEELKMAPVYSSAARAAAKSPPPGMSGYELAQYGLLGWHREMPSSEYVPDGLDDKLPEAYKISPMPMILNTDTPWSAFICGSQGSGKSHTLACMLENCLTQDTEIGKLSHPLAGIVLHFDKGSPLACEAAKLCSESIKVKVLVSPVHIKAFKKLYKEIPGARDNLEVLPLKFLPKHLSAGRMKNLMAFEEGDKMPLYMATVTRELQKRAKQADFNGLKNFDYRDFRDAIMRQLADHHQKNMLDQRFQNLDWFLTDGKNDVFEHEPGTLTIVDLTSSFIDAAEACQLFDICLAVFMESGTSPSGHPLSRVVALDEAHKYLKESTHALSFTDNLLSIIRTQRHQGTRIIVATQEPTLSPDFLDLCSMTIIHRFTSPHWFSKLLEHVGGLSPNDDANEDQDAAGSQKKDLFSEIMELDVGEAIFCGPTAMIGVDSDEPKKLSKSFLRWKTRGRMTTDGGKSIQASSSEV